MYETLYKLSYRCSYVDVNSYSTMYQLIPFHLIPSYIQTQLLPNFFQYILRLQLIILINNCSDYFNHVG